MNDRRFSRNVPYFRPQTTSAKIVAQVCTAPFMSPDEIAGSLSRLNLSIAEVTDTLTQLGFLGASDRETIVFSRWNWEVIFLRNIVSFCYGEEDPNEWLENVAKQLQDAGLSIEGSRLWIQSLLWKMHLRVAPGSDFYIPPNNEHHLGLLRSIALDEVLQVPNDGHDQERLFRFVSWASARLYSALNPQGVELWTPDHEGENIAIEHMMQILTRLFSDIPRNRRISQWALYAAKDMGLFKADVRSLYQNWWRMTGGWPNDVGWQHLREICEGLQTNSETDSSNSEPETKQQSSIDLSVGHNDDDSRMKANEEFVLPRTSATAASFHGNLSTTIAELPWTVRQHFNELYSTIDKLTNQLQHLTMQFGQIAAITRDTTARSESWRVQIHNLQQQQHTLEQELLADFVLRWSLGEDKEQSINSGLNRLYRWAIDTDPERVEAASFAKELLYYFRGLGVTTRKTDQVGTIVELGVNAVEEWNFISGPRFTDYKGYGLVLAPEWRLGEDILLEQSWVKPPPP